MTAALAEAPVVAWFVPVTVPARPPARPAVRRPGRSTGRPGGPPGRRRLALVGSPEPAGPGVGRPVRPAVRVPSGAPQVRLRLTRRGAHLMAVGVLALTLLGGVERLEAGPPIGVASAPRVAPGASLTSSAAFAVGTRGR